MKKAGPAKPAGSFNRTDFSSRAYMANELVFSPVDNTSL